MKASQAESKAQRKAEHEARLAAERAKTAAAAGSDGAPPVEKSKAQLKAERRAQQEAQRAAKTAASGDNNSNNNKTATKENKIPQNSQTSSSQNASKKLPDNGQQTPKPSQSTNEPLNGSNNHLTPTSATVSKSPAHSSPEKSPEKDLSKPGVIYSNMFAHLPTRPSDLTDISLNGIPPRIVEVGYRINQNYYKGSTMKCVAILTAFQQIVNEYEPKSEGKLDLKHELQNLLFHDCHRFLAACSPISIAMENAMKHLKVSFTKIEPSLGDIEMKQEIVDIIGQFVKEDMIQACEAIIRKMQSKINDDDVIMTLGYSTMLRNAFILAWKNGRRFRVVAVDTRPNCEGKEMAEALINAGIPVTYCLVSAISYIIHTVTRVFVEAHALMGNGYVMSHSGAALIALVAHSANVQFLVCCETYKFSDRVHTDSFVHNELGSEEAFFKSIPADKRPPIDGLPALHVMDMLYDLTPHEFVTTIVTEKSLMPATSVPIILRIRESK